LVFSFHGWQEDIQLQYSRSKFNEIADQEGFILVTPQALPNDDGNIIWNVRYPPLNNNSPNDVGFISTLIDSMSAIYHIDLDRVYSFGFSNGGYFSFELGCLLSDRIAAIGSVGGAMNQFQHPDCTPTRAIPVVQLHGTSDQLIGYEEAVKLINFYISNNQTSAQPITTNLEDIDPNDGSSVQHILYVGGENDSEISHFKVIGGDHDWFGYQGNMDIDASEEIWQFLSQFDINGKIN
jgi:polyhydroxybutyrate depolymerase